MNALRFLTVVLALLLVTTVGGVFATWHYATLPTPDVIANLAFTLDEYHFSEKPDEEIVLSLAERFLRILNNYYGTGDYERLNNEMSANYNSSKGDWTASYIGNVAGSSDDDSALIRELFRGALTLTVNGNTVNVTCIVKRENIDGKRNTGMSYTVGRTTYSGCEMTLYVATANLNNLQYNNYPTVYALVFTKTSTNGPWIQIGEPMYVGKAQVVGYVGGTTTGSFDTGTWSSTQTYGTTPSGASISTLIKKVRY